MKILNFLTKPLCSRETKMFIMFCFASVLWLFLLICVMRSENPQAADGVVIMAASLLMVTFTYTEYRVASVKKELLKEQEEIKFALKVQEQVKYKS